MVRNVNIRIICAIVPAAIFFNPLPSSPPNAFADRIALTITKMLEIKIAKNAIFNNKLNVNGEIVTVKVIYLMISPGKWEVKKHYIYGIVSYGKKSRYQ